MVFMVMTYMIKLQNKEDHVYELQQNENFWRRKEGNGNGTKGNSTVVF